MLQLINLNLVILLQSSHSQPYFRYKKEDNLSSWTDKILLYDIKKPTMKSLFFVAKKKEERIGFCKKRKISLNKNSACGLLFR